MGPTLAASVAVYGIWACFIGLSVAWAQENPIEDLLVLIDASRTGGWIVISVAAINLLTSLTKKLFANWIPKRWRFMIPVVLSGIAGILSNILGGVPAIEATWVGLFSGPSAVFTHRAVKDAIFGRTETRPSGVPDNHGR